MELFSRRIIEQYEKTHSVQWWFKSLSTIYLGHTNLMWSSMKMTLVSCFAHYVKKTWNIASWKSLSAWLQNFAFDYLFVYTSSIKMLKAIFYFLLMENVSNESWTNWDVIDIILKSCFPMYTPYILDMIYIGNYACWSIVLDCQV